MKEGNRGSVAKEKDKEIEVRSQRNTQEGGTAFIIYHLENSEVRSVTRKAGDER